MNLIERFHKEVGVLVEGDVWNMELPKPHITEGENKNE